MEAAADILPKAIYHQVAHDLRAALPPPVTDSPEDAARRDIAAIAHVAALRPADADEANLAVQYVAAGAQALDCLRLARAYADNPKAVLQCTAQAANMMRQARGWRVVLRRAQAARLNRQADPAAAEAAAAVETRALCLLAEALTLAPPPPAPTPKPDVVAQAEQYAQQHRKRAVLIRRFGRVPDRLQFGPILPEVVHAIATGTTPILRALDDTPKRSATAAA